MITESKKPKRASPDDAYRLVDAMSLKQTLEAFESLDSARASGRTVVELLARYPAASVTVEEVRGGKGKTDFVKVVIAGARGRLRGGTARTLGIVGKLGGLLRPWSSLRSRSRRNSVDRRPNFTTPRSSRDSMSCMARCTACASALRAPE